MLLFIDFQNCSMSRIKKNSLKEIFSRQKVRIRVVCVFVYFPAIVVCFQ